MATDQEALILQISADVSRLQKQFATAVKTVNDGSAQMEGRSKKAARGIEDSFGNIAVDKALKKVFDSSKFNILEEGAAHLRVFGSALEPLGPLGIATAAGIFAVAVAAENVKRAMEEVGALKIESDKTGVPVEALQELQYAAKESHVPVEALNQALLNLQDTLGKLRSTVGAGRLQKLAEELGLTPADLANVRTANDLLPILAERIKALPTLSEQYAAAAKAGVVEILPLLLKGKDGVAELMTEYRNLGIEVSGPVAAGVAAGNLELERAHEITHDKLRNSLIELQPLIVGLSTAWDGFAAHAIDALTATTNAYARFVANAARLANQKTDNPGADFGARLLGSANLALTHPLTAVGAVLGIPAAQRFILNGPTPPPARAEAATAAAVPTGPTPAQLAAELVAKQKLDELEAKYLTHTTNRLEAERKIEEINAKRVAAGDQPIDKSTADQILAAASAQDAKPGDRAAESARRKAEAAQRKREAAQLKAQEQVDRQIQEIDEANKNELTARLALTTSVVEQAKLRDQEIDQERDKANDKAAGQLAEKKINQATYDRLVVLNDRTAEEKRALVAAQLHDQLAQTALQVAEAGDAAQLATLNAQKDVASTLGERRDLELRILRIQQEEERARIEAVLASKTATDAEKKVAQAELDALPTIQSAQKRQLLTADEEPIQRYMRSIQDLDTEIQNQAIGAFQQLSDSLGQAAAKALGLKGPLGQLFSTIFSLAFQRSQGGFLSDLVSLIPHFAGGTQSAPGGVALVGEKGPELVNLPRGAQVFPNSALDALSKASVPEGGRAIVDYRVTIDLAGANGDETIRRIAYQAAAQGGAAAYAAAVRDVPRNMARRARRVL
jgi:hypothetical protein